MVKSVLGNIRLSGEFAGGMAPQPAASGVETVTGTAVNNSDPKNPVVNYPAVADVSGLTAALATKADDSAVVHLAGTETITGAKTFSAATVFSGNATINGTLVQGANSAELIVGTVRNSSVTVSSAANNYCDATAGNITLTLPAASAANACRIMFTKFDSSANTVTIAAPAGANINGAANTVLTTQYQSVTLLCIHGAVVNTWIIQAKGP